MKFTEGIVLHHTFTLHTWVNIPLDDDNKTIFSIVNNTGVSNDEVDYLNWMYR
jgi:hypothetical protein